MDKPHIYLILGPGDDGFEEIFMLAYRVVRDSLGIDLDVTVLHSPDENAGPRLNYRGVDVLLKDMDLYEIVDLLAAAGAPWIPPVGGEGVEAAEA